MANALKDDSSEKVRGFSDEEILDLPTVIDNVDAGRIFGICARTMTRVADDEKIPYVTKRRRRYYPRDAVLAAAGISYNEIYQRVQQRNLLKMRYDAEMKKLTGKDKPEGPTTEQKKAMIAMMSQMMGLSEVA